MTVKQCIARVILGVSLIVSVSAHATTSNYTTYVDGSVLTAASLNSLQTHYTDADNAILNGDTYTGNNIMHSGSDVLFYSDTGSNLEAGIYGEDGDILGAPRRMGAYGITLSLSSGVFTVQCQGATCSATNPGHIVMESETSGSVVVLRVTSSNTFSDRTATSDLTGMGMGIIETVDWNQDIPMFLYVVNEGNNDIDGSDGGSVFAFSRDPTLATTSSDADDIHDTDEISANDTQNNIFLLDDVTNDNYVSQPMLLVGGFAMQFDTDTADDWTITAFTDAVGGVGPNKLATQFASTWTMPLGQNNAAAGSPLLDNSGAAPIFTTNSYTYMVEPTGHVSFYTNIDADGGTDGTGAVTSILALPCADNLAHVYNMGSGLVRSATGTDQAVTMQLVSASSSQAAFTETSSTEAVVQNGDFTNGARTIRVGGRLKCW